MANQKGKIGWIPAVVLEELDDIKREDRIPKMNDAFKELTRYARVGRETKRLIRLDFSRSRKLPPIPKSRKRRTTDFPF